MATGVNPLSPAAADTHTLFATAAPPSFAYRPTIGAPAQPTMALDPTMFPNVMRYYNPSATATVPIAFQPHVVGVGMPVGGVVGGGVSPLLPYQFGYPLAYVPASSMLSVGPTMPQQIADGAANSTAILPARR
ncbi:hypothetical protein HK405_001652, partial [Cladochytrium tenue]